MTLRGYQQTLTLGRLYEVRKASKSAVEQGGPNIWVDSGSIDLHESQSATVPTALANMPLITGNTAIAGGQKLELISRYIAPVQNTGTTTEIVVSGLDVEDLGAIS